MIGKRRPAWFRRARPGMPEGSGLEQLADAMTLADEQALRGVLRPDAVLIVDSGGMPPGASASSRGRTAVAAALRELSTPGVSAVASSINGAPGLVLSRDGLVVAAVTAEMHAGLLSHVWVVMNPEKLRHWNRG